MSFRATICPHNSNSQLVTAQGTFCLDCGTLRALPVQNKHVIQLGQTGFGHKNQVSFFESLEGIRHPNKPRSKPNHSQKGSLNDITAKKPTPR